MSSNLWGRSVDCSRIHDPWGEPPEHLYTLTKTGAECPNEPAYVELTFERGTPVAINGVAMLVIVPLLVSACGKTVGETIDDATITTRVKTALLNDPQVAGLKIDVDTTNGIVTMSGLVKSRNEEQRAVTIARGVPGVKDVKSTLQLQTAQP